MTGLLDRIDDRFRLLAGADRLAPSRQQSLAATVEWSYRLLDQREQQVFRLVALFPGPFTLEAAEAVAGESASAVLLRLVDCSLVVPPRPGPDGQSRYVMLETLRAYGTGLLATAGEQPAAAAALAGYALRAAEQAAAGLETGIAETLAARRLDAEDATVQQALAWAVDHDPATGLRLAVALAPWWFLRGRLAGEYPLLRRAASYAAAGSNAWCAAQFWLGYTAMLSADLDGALGHFTAVRDAGQGPVLAAGLAGRSLTLAYLSRAAEAADDGRRSLALAQELGDPAGEARALVNLSIAAYAAGDIQDAAGLARQAGQISAEVPGPIARAVSNILTMVLTETGDLGAAGRVCAAGLARSREVGDLWSLTRLLTQMAGLDMRGDRMEEASGCLREALQTAWRTGGRSEVLGALNGCGHLCAATRRHAEAVTVWAAHAALSRHEGRTDWPPSARHRHESLHDARQALGAVQARAAQERGTVMSLATAAEYALMLTADPGRDGVGDAAAIRQLGTVGRHRQYAVSAHRGRSGRAAAALAAQSAADPGAAPADPGHLRPRSAADRRLDRHLGSALERVHGGRRRARTCIVNLAC